MPTRFAAAGIRVLKSETCCGRKCGSPGLTDQLRMKREAKAGRASSEQTANYESEAAKERSFFAVNLTGGRAKPKAVATPTRNPTPIHSPPQQSHKRKGEKPSWDGKMKSGERRESRVESREPRNEQKQTEQKKEDQTKVENLRKATKCYISSPDSGPKATDQPSHPSTHAPTHWLSHVGVKSSKRVRKRAEGGERGVPGNQPENALFSLPRPDAITANEGTSCRPPFLFFPTHRHTHTPTHSPTHSPFNQLKTHTSAVALGTHTGAHILWLSTIHHKMSRMTKS